VTKFLLSIRRSLSIIDGCKEIIENESPQNFNVLINFESERPIYFFQSWRICGFLISKKPSSVTTIIIEIKL